MCQYCGCRDIETVGLLTEDHVEIQNHCGDTRRAVEAGDFKKAAQLARKLKAIFAIHNAVEEQALYLSIGRNEEFADKTGDLFDEHDELDELIDDIIRHDDDGTLDQVDWKRVLDAYDVLYEHIIAEENGLFPAAAIMFDPADWERCERMRAEAEAKAGVGHGESPNVPHDPNHLHGHHDHPHDHVH
jgi:hemerythrin superfamily protein